MMNIRNKIHDAIKSLEALGMSKFDATNWIVNKFRIEVVDYFMNEAKPEPPKPITNRPANSLGEYYLSTDVNAFYQISRLIDSGLVDHKKLRNVKYTGGYISNNKIDAIIIVRHLTGWYIKEIKDFIVGKPHHLTNSEYILLREMFGNALLKKDEPTLGDILNTALERHKNNTD